MSYSSALFVPNSPTPFLFPFCLHVPSPVSSAVTLFKGKSTIHLLLFPHQISSPCNEPHPFQVMMHWMWRVAMSPVATPNVLMEIEKQKAMENKKLKEKLITYVEPVMNPPTQKSNHA